MEEIKCTDLQVPTFGPYSFEINDIAFITDFSTYTKDTFLQDAPLHVIL